MRKLWILVLIMFVFSIQSCGYRDETKSASGVNRATVQVQTDSNGNTVEQKNIGQRVIEDNKIGSIKHLYIISPYSGQVLMYSTVKGKVTSSKKRLTPRNLAGPGVNGAGWFGFKMNGETYATTEVLEDDGTYGESMSYLYWWDTKGIYHQHYIGGAEILHISDRPLAVKSVTINMNTEGEKQ